MFLARPVSRVSQVLVTCRLRQNRNGPNGAGMRIAPDARQPLMRVVSRLENRDQLVVYLVRDRVELMALAANAVQGQPEDCLHRNFHRELLRGINFLLLSYRLVIGRIWRAAEKTRSEERRVGKECRSRW